MDKVVHFEIPVDDVARATAFYGPIFGWDLQEMDMGNSMYTIVMTTPVDEKTQLPTEPGAINGGLMKRSADTPAPVITIGVGSIDDALKQVEAAGGGTIQPKTEIPGMGAYAYFRDTEGNVMGLWQLAE
jgi:predicted enzyme related to lactoylglutathione lyase